MGYWYVALADFYNFSLLDKRNKLAQIIFKFRNICQLHIHMIGQLYGHVSRFLFIVADIKKAAGSAFALPSHAGQKGLRVCFFLNRLFVHCLFVHYRRHSPDASCRNSLSNGNGALYKKFVKITVKYI